MEIGEFGGRRLRLRGGDLAAFQHAIQYKFCLSASALRVRHRVELRWRTDDAGKHRGFPEIKFAHVLVEIDSSGCRDAGRTRPHVYVVEVTRQDFVLAKFSLQPECDDRILDFPLPGALFLQIEDLDQLLRDRAAALDDFAGPQIPIQRPGYASQVDARMLVEAAILRG